jgi:hypothetical protein
MSIANGVRASASNFNNAFVSRTSDTDTSGRFDLVSGNALSGSSILNIQRAINSIASALGMTNAEVFDYLITWSDDSVGAANDTLVERLEALVERFNGTTGHSHDGTDGNGPLISSSSIVNTQANSAATGNIDALDSSLGSTIRLITIGTATLRGIDNGSSGKRLVVMNITGSPLTVKNNDSNPAASDKIITGTGDDIEIQDGAAIFFEYDGTSLVWRAISGSGGGNFLLKQEVPSGVVDGINDTFGPFALTPIADDAISVFVDGVYRPQSAYTVTGGNTVVFDAGEIPALGQQVEVTYLYKISGSVVPASGLSVSPKTEFRTLSNPEIAAQQLTLVNTPTVPSEIGVWVYGGSVAWVGVDYSVSGNIVSWGGLGFDGLLTSGDKLVIQYYY